MTTPDPFSPEAASNYDLDVSHGRTASHAAPAVTTGAVRQFGSAAGTSPASHSPMGTPLTDGVAIAALVAGLVGTGLIAVTLGVVGLRRTAHGARSGKGMAWAGIILGAISTLVWTTVIVLIVVGFMTVGNLMMHSPSGVLGEPLGQSEAHYGDPRS